MGDTTTTGTESTLTIDVLRDAYRKLAEGGRSPVFLFSHAVPWDQAFHGDGVDKLAQQLFPGFDPSLNKAYLVSKRYEKDYEDWKAKQQWPTTLNTS